MLVDSESLIRIDFIPLFVIHVGHPHFPLNGIKKYLIWLDRKAILCHPLKQRGTKNSLSKAISKTKSK